jgi:hypothetical protein
MRNPFEKILFIIIPICYAFFCFYVFTVNSWEGVFGLMTMTFLYCVPSIIGGLTIFFSNIEKVRKLTYGILMPWVPIMLFFGLTLFFNMEGWACWLMVMPLFLIAATIGGLIVRYFRLKRKDNKLYVSIIVILPFILSPLEQSLNFEEKVYKAYTYIDIAAKAEKIWENVVRVKEIPIEQDKGLLTKTLGFPRPLKAELNFLGVGAKREAIFTNGLVFHETVTEYIDQKKMVFNIKAYPHEIPSTTMDEHVVIGGKYFDVLNGTYELEKLNEKTHRLHLYSKFKMNTNFNYYSSFWAKLIMKDIQNNILQVEKARAEQE